VSPPPIRHELTVPVSQGRAFEAFTDGLATWWPPEYTWSAGVLETIAIDPRTGGRCYERGPHGFSCDWGRVTACEPPARLVFLWQIAPDRTPQPDPGRSSEVEVRFADEGGSTTRVALEHRAFERHGDEGGAYREGMASDQGWPELLRRYAAALGG
jgi:uncharacterized protein YndB with AHSA1/START domain